jgi:hypothetical protein
VRWCRRCWRRSWRSAPRLSIEARAQLTVPIPVTDASLALRYQAGPVAVALGWRDVRFIPVFAIPAVSDR